MVASSREKLLAAIMEKLTSFSPESLEEINRYFIESQVMAVVVLRESTKL